MSLQTWCAKFYRCSAASKEATRTLLAAVEHSLKKWQGLRARHLKAHDIPISRYLVDRDDPIDILFIDGDTCALCHFYMSTDWECDCDRCILKEIRGVQCDESIDGEKSPFGSWLDNLDPEPMIKLLLVARRKVKADEKSGNKRGTKKS